MILSWPLLVAGLAGTPHCAVMCGPLMGAVSRNRWDRILYQLGRLGGYVGLATLISLSGKQIDHRFPLLFGVFFGATMIVMGLHYGGWLPLRWPQISLKFHTIFGGLFQASRKVGPVARLGLMVGLGMASVSLPCGYLYGVLLGFSATVDTRSAVIGMGLFWLGTLPGLLLLPWGLQRLSAPFSRVAKPFFALTLMGIGILVLGIRLGLWGFGGHSCH